MDQLVFPISLFLRLFAANNLPVSNRKKWMCVKSVTEQTVVLGCIVQAAHADVLQCFWPLCHPWLKRAGCCHREKSGIKVVHRRDSSITLISVAVHTRQLCQRLLVYQRSDLVLEVIHKRTLTTRQLLLPLAPIPHAQKIKMSELCADSLAQSRWSKDQRT